MNIYQKLQRAREIIKDNDIEKDKFRSFISDINELKNKYQFKSKKYITLRKNVNGLIDKIVEYSMGKIN